MNLLVGTKPLPDECRADEPGTAGNEQVSEPQLAQLAPRAITLR